MVPRRSPHNLKSETVFFKFLIGRYFLIVILIYIRFLYSNRALSMLQMDYLCKLPVVGIFLYTFSAGLTVKKLYRGIPRSAVSWLYQREYKPIIFDYINN